MQTVALIYNPVAGRGPSFPAALPALTRLLEHRGLTVTVAPTTADPASARLLAARAALSCGLVIACGGDGTVHGVLQGVAHTGATLGVLPFGTANALARNLGLSLDPVVALDQLLAWPTRCIPLGEASTAAGTRFFTVMAGAGPDGRLVHEMVSAAKRHLGRRAYYAEAARLFLSRRFPAFTVEYRTPASPRWHRTRASAVMAARIGDLGGLFGGLTAGSRVEQTHLRVQIIAPPAHIGIPAWFGFSRLGLSARNPWLQTVEVEELRCHPMTDRETYAQVDGEPAGPIPLAVRIVPDALSLRMPVNIT